MSPNKLLQIGTWDIYPGVKATGKLTLTQPQIVLHLGDVEITSTFLARFHVTGLCHGYNFTFIFVAVK
jgi:hypothetical protein